MHTSSASINKPALAFSILIVFAAFVFSGDKIFHINSNSFTITSFFDKLLTLRNNSFFSNSYRPSTNVNNNQQKSESQSITRLILKKSEEHNIDEKLVTAVIHSESGFNPRAVSRVGAQGLMQIMPSTGKTLGLSDPFDVEQNIDAGCRYLREQLDRFNDLDLALSAYNAGPGAVAAWKGVPPYPETRRFVAKVKALAKQPARDKAPK